MKKIYFITILVIVILVSLFGITYSFEYDTDGSLTFEFIGPSTLYIDVNSRYAEYGIKATYNGTDISSRIVIDDSNVDVTKLGEYKVKYSYNQDYVYRTVIVIDKSAPVIELIGGEEVNILLGGKYQEAGYTVTDNYDKDLHDKVVKEGNVDTGREGEYIITYTVTDSSGNSSSVKRKVVVKKAVINANENFANRVSYNSYNVYLYSNTIVKNNFYKYGIYYEGYTSDVAKNYKIKLKNKDNKLEYFYNMSVLRNNYYGGNLNLTTLENGTYEVYLIGSREERVMNKLDVFSKIVRSKVGNKLATLIYDNDLVSITIEDFKYHYDIAIDPGHGGSDIGTANGIMAEKDLNLKISKYEKCRYESMGYSVYMIRYDDSNGEVLGNNYLDPLDRRAMAIGYYGSVSRVTYSNHHNGSLNMGEHGFEILVPNSLTAKELASEFSIYRKFSEIENIHDDKIRMYGKDYDIDTILNKANGEVYANKNYYSVIRIPYEMFNVKNVIYEPIYMTSPSDFNWYYSGGNWIKMSEAKIEEYVKYMGGTYNPDNKKCL